MALRAELVEEFCELRALVLQRLPAAVILSGQNIDRDWMKTVFAGGTPRAL
jgi:hypothetical protein